MNFEPDEEQIAMIDAVKRFLSEKLPLSRFRGSAGDGDNAHWKELAELGLFGVTATAAEGGMGLSLADETLIFRELGRHLVSPCALATVVARRVAALQGDPALVALLLNGGCRVAFAFERAVVPSRAERPFFLIDGEHADKFLITSLKGLALVSRDTFSGASGGVESLDDSIDISVSNLNPCATIAYCSDLQTTLTLATLASAVMVGAAEAALGASVEYAKLRQQFGAAIGSFQAIKHMCADNAVRVDAAWSQTLWAGLALQEQTADADQHVAAASLLADDAARHTAQDNVQIHGGMGFTAECDAHWYVKRRHVLSRLVAHCVDAYALLLGWNQNGLQAGGEGNAR